jgi:hypothetical protein
MPFDSATSRFDSDADHFRRTIMIGLALTLSLAFSPEKTLERELCSVKIVQIESRVSGSFSILVLENPQSLLAKLSVLRVHHSAGAGRSDYRIRFGDREPYWLWLDGSNHDLTTDDESPGPAMGIDLAPGFKESLNKAMRN